MSYQKEERNRQIIRSYYIKYRKVTSESRLWILRFKTVTMDPMAFTAASHDLVNDYKEIHKERFNLECADAGYNIPKF